MNSTNKFLLILFGIVLILGAIALPYTYYKAKAKCLSYEFDGTVDSISYSVKGEPTIKIHGNKYNLPVNFWDFKRQIEVGDSLIKAKDSMVVRIFKKNGTLAIK
ncbi:MAG: hypothetical protein JWP78_1000 [Mucilaginibacter sp.]|nr:hypothetical protein [Mucilaginibacter sp.]